MSRVKDCLCTSDLAAKDALSPVDLFDHVAVFYWFKELVSTPHGFVHAAIVTLEHFCSKGSHTPIVLLRNCKLPRHCKFDMSKNRMFLRSFRDHSILVFQTIEQPSLTLPLTGCWVNEARFSLWLWVVVGRNCWLDFIQDAIAFASGSECRDAFASVEPRLTI